MLHAIIKQYGVKYYAVIINDIFGDGTYMSTVGCTGALSLPELKHYLHGKYGVPKNNMTRSKPA